MEYLEVPECNHRTDIAPFCLKCVSIASKLESVSATQNCNLMDNFLSVLGKKRQFIKADGHCLPRSVFTGLKKKGLIQDCYSYKQLFRKTVSSILGSSKYIEWFTDCEEDVKKQLQLYETKKFYNSNIVDIFIAALTDVSSVTIIAYYVAEDDKVLSHIFQPPNESPSTCIELTFMNGHYDLVVDNIKILNPTVSTLNITEIIEISDSPPSKAINNLHNNLKAEVKEEIVQNNLSYRQSISPTPRMRMKAESLPTSPSIIYDNYEIHHQTSNENDDLEPNHYQSDDDELPTFHQYVEKVEQLSSQKNSNSNQNNTFDMHSDFIYQGRRKYIKPNVFDKIKTVIAQKVPDGIDGVIIYEIPQGEDSNLENSKGSRPWGNAVTSKSKQFTKGPRLLFNCRGSYLCKNSKCKNIDDFGVNRKDFFSKNDIVSCSICGMEATFVECEARLIIEKDNERKRNICKHYGTHTCPVEIKNRVKQSIIEKVSTRFPKLTRESFIRQEIQGTLERSNYSAAVELSKDFTDTTYIDNIRKKTILKRRPDGHSFKAVDIIQKNFQKEDKFLVYDFNDGTNNESPFVLKSSRRKVEMLVNLDKDGCHRLSKVPVYLDVLHSRCKSWKTYTLSHYDDVLRELVKLVTMETTNEDGKCCEIFFRLINRMCQDFAADNGNIPSVFNPVSIKCDEHQGNKIGIKAVFGNTFLEERTGSCLFHFDKSVQKHAHLIHKSERGNYFKLLHELKNSVTIENYAATKKSYEMVIAKQEVENRKSLSDTLSYWDTQKYRWATAFCNNLHATPESSLAEAAQASMKSGNEKNISLVDAIYADISDSARFDAKWLKRLSGERCQGKGPTAVVLDDRYEQRQINRAYQYVEESSRLVEQHNDDENRKRSSIPISSQNLPKVKKSRQRSLDSGYVQKAIEKAEKINHLTKVVELTRHSSSIDLTIQSKSDNYNLQISTDFSCSCGSFKTASRRTCCHIVWALIYVFGISKTSNILAQIEVSSESFAEVCDNLPDSLPDSVTQCNGNRTFHEKLKEHDKFNTEQV